MTLTPILRLLRWLMLALIVLLCLGCLVLILSLPPPLSPNVRFGFATSTALAGGR